MLSKSSCNRLVIQLKMLDRRMEVKYLNNVNLSQNSSKHPVISYCQRENQIVLNDFSENGIQYGRLTTNEDIPYFFLERIKDLRNAGYGN